MNNLAKSGDRKGDMRLASTGAYFLLGSLTGAAVAGACPYTVRRVDGPSMRPTLNPEPDVRAPPFFDPPSDVVLVRKIGDLEDREAAGLVGSVVCLEHPKKRGASLIKRLTAAAGQSVSPLNGSGPVRVPEGCCWVRSDAGRGYADSEWFGPVPVTSVKEVALLVLWPPSRAGRLGPPPPPPPAQE